VKAVFCCSERDSIRLLHKFGAEEKNNSLSLPRSSLLAQLEAIRVGSTYAAFLRQRQDVAKHLSAARAETAARQFRVRPAVQERPARLEDLPPTITWRRASMVGPGRFEVVYADGADLICHLVVSFGSAGVNREEFFAGTEPSDDPPDNGNSLPSVQVEAFEGPLDLLLDEVRRQGMWPSRRSAWRRSRPVFSNTYGLPLSAI
jgi:hypothetical protein